MQAQTFLPDDPLRVDPDRMTVPKPTPRDQGDLWDFVETTLVTPGEEGVALGAGHQPLHDALAREGNVAGQQPE